jgi:hypothetical protein
MDGDRFDKVTRALASGGSRRSLLKALLGLGAAAATGKAVLSDSDARTVGTRPSVPTPKPPVPTPTRTPTLAPTPTPACSGFPCGFDCCDAEVQCCDGECCPRGHECLTKRFPESPLVEEEVCCPAHRVCDAATTKCCPDGEVCQDNRCCRGLDAPCTSNSQCCTGPGGIGGTCLNGLCKPCADANTRCNHDDDCCSGACYAGLCLAGCAPPASSCDSHQDCCPGSSTGQGFCVGGVCCLGLDDTCQTDGQCCPGPGGAGGSCIDGICQPCADTSDSCVHDDDCCTGICIGQTCQAACSENGGVCDSDQDCCQPDSGESDCRGGHCCLGQGSACTEGVSDCCPGESLSVGICQGNACAICFVNGGGPCFDNFDCCSGVCVNSFCQLPTTTSTTAPPP